MTRCTTRILCVAVAAALYALAAPGSALADDYVALGDSYSSGVGTNSSNLDAGCVRSTRAYPYLVSRQRPNTALTFVACAAATTDSVMASQIQAVNPSTDIVTITIGGNDAGFGPTIYNCTVGWPCHGQIDAANNFIRNALPAKLDMVYSAIRRRAPNARVVVVGYPRLFANGGGRWCPQVSGIDWFERNALNRTADLMDQVIAARAAANGLTYRSAIPSFTGHAVCQNEWINGLNVFIAGESYHPSANGHTYGYTPLVRSVIG